MAKNKPYTVVYVYAPSQFKDAYMDGKIIPEVKIGETTADANDCDSCMHAALKRINQYSTGFKEYMYLLQWFVFPYKKGIDNQIRKILAKCIYKLKTSQDQKKPFKHDERLTHIGKEYVYNVSIAQVNTAISVYKLKAKIEELMRDPAIDNNFKIRLKRIMESILSDLGAIVDEGPQDKEELDETLQFKISLLDKLY